MPVLVSNLKGKSAIHYILASNYGGSWLVSNVSTTSYAGGISVGGGAGVVW